MNGPTDWFELAKELCVPDPRAKALEPDPKTLDSLQTGEQTRRVAPEILRLPRR